MRPPQHTKISLNVRIPFENAKFIKELSETSKIPVSQIADEAINLYRKYMLWKELREGFSNQTAEDVKEAMSDFNDYLSIVDRD